MGWGFDNFIVLLSGNNDGFDVVDELFVDFVEMFFELVFKCVSVME